MLTGTVIVGKNLGKQIGFPTANLCIKETYKLIPKNGSYIVKSNIEGKTVCGMMNIGINPTVMVIRNQLKYIFLILIKTCMQNKFK